MWGHYVKDYVIPDALENIDRLEWKDYLEFVFDGQEIYMLKNSLNDIYLTLRR